MFNEKNNKDEEAHILQKAIDSFPYPFYIIDVDTYQIEIANKFLGIDLESYDCKKCKCHKITHRNEEPCSGKKDPCPIAEIRKTGEPVFLEHVHYDSDGRARDVKVHAFPIFDENGEFKKMVEYSIDITEEKKIERKSKKHAEEIKKMNELMMGRELKMVEMKKEIERLKNKK